MDATDIAAVAFLGLFGFGLIIFRQDALWLVAKWQDRMPGGNRSGLDRQTERRLLEGFIVLIGLSFVVAATAIVLAAARQG